MLTYSTRGAVATPQDVFDCLVAPKLRVCPPSTHGVFARLCGALCHPCCVLGGDRKTPGDPLNVVFVGG